MADQLSNIVGHENLSQPGPGIQADAPHRSFLIHILKIYINFQTIRIWDASTGLCLATLLGHDNWVRGLAFHPGGKYLLSVSDDKSLRIWDVAHRFASKVIKSFSHNCRNVMHDDARSLAHSLTSHLFIAGVVRSGWTRTTTSPPQSTSTAPRPSPSAAASTRPSRCGSAVERGRECDNLGGIWANIGTYLTHCEIENLLGNALLSIRLHGRIKFLFEKKNVILFRLMRKEYEKSVAK